MAYRNYYRVVLSNDFLGVSKEISAPTRYELDAKVENQKRIWDERVKREIAKQNKEEMKRKAEQLTKNDEKKIESYKNIINKSAIRKQKCREQCNVYHLCNGGCLNESILAGGIENIPEFSCTAFSIIISHIKTRMQEAISRGIEFENIYNKYIRNIIKKRLEMNKNVK